MLDSDRQISRATVRRIPLYYRAVLELQREGIRRVRSDKLSEMVHVPSATIRRDFSSFGELGRSGYGYEVDTLEKEFGSLLEVRSSESMVLVGVGGLGAALLKNNFRRNPDLNIVIAYDEAPQKIGHKLANVPIYPFSKLAETLPKNVTTAIVAVPSASQPLVIPTLEAAGINAIMTFAPQPVACKPTTTIRYIDLTSELQSLLFTAHEKQKKAARKPQAAR